MNTENNKIIAEFMGFKKGTFGAKTYEKYGDTWDIVESFMPEEFKYHTDWNWLMEVVEKIESLGYYFRFLGNGWIIIVDLSENETIEITNESKIIACYNACLEFIKWYNEQRNQNIQDSIDVDSWSK